MNNLRKVSSAGEEHGLINQVANSVQDDGFKNINPKIKEQCEKQKKEDNKLVKARYFNKRGNNERLEMAYCRWAGDPIQTWKFIPDEVYEVPKGLVEQVNKSCLAQRSEVLDREGVPTIKEGQGLHIHQFIPVGF